jgi:thioredoxin-like negative regulator of GroEL
VDFTEVAYDQEPEVHQRVGVTGVPLVVIRDAAGVEVRRFAGVMPKARLAVALGRERH